MIGVLYVEKAKQYFTNYLFAEMLIDYGILWRRYWELSVQVTIDNMLNVSVYHRTI